MSIDEKCIYFEKLYGSEKEYVESQKKRYLHIRNAFIDKFNSQPTFWFSTPGRTEIGGNHTDHNHGRVLAAAVNLDAVAAVSPCDELEVTLFSEGYKDPFIVSLNDLQKKEEEKSTTNALIRGIAFRLRNLGYAIGGFKAYVQSDVLPGSGLSSSAAIEVLLGTIFNYLYNDGKISAPEIAMIGQFAENKYFGKPCGLMDQMTCAIGGIITIDFKNPYKPKVEPVTFDFNSQGYRLIVVDTGGNHADLTEDYAAVPEEMKVVAKALGKSVCREITMVEWLENLASLREAVGDRAILRAFHFIQENDRVARQIQALRANQFEQFLALVKQSGDSSFKWLQNIYTTKNVVEQGVTLALALSEDFIDSIGQGASRVHGGGFAGTIQVFLPINFVDDYVQRMEKIFGQGSVNVLNIRPFGSVCVEPKYLL